MPKWIKSIKLDLSNPVRCSVCKIQLGFKGFSPAVKDGRGGLKHENC